MLWLIISFFVAAAVVPFVYRERRIIPYLFILLLPAVTSGYFLLNLPHILSGQKIEQVHHWAPSLGVSLHFYLDGLSLFFSLLVTVFGFLVVLYARSYMKGHEKQGLFFGYLLLFMGAMLGIVLSANMISLFLFWELTSLSSFLLIGFDPHKKGSREAAIQALLITSGGGFALLASVLLLGSLSAGGFDLTYLINNAEILPTGTLKTSAIILLLVAASTKSAQFPFHFWLPNAMEAPTPVSAYLHAATMVKAGVYLILRMTPAFADVPIWHDLLTGIGAISMVVAGWYAFQADDLKEILAYTTISALGIFFMMTGVGSTTAIEATMVYIMAHALYKGALFFVAGNIDHQTGTRLISSLGNLSRKMPFTSAGALIAYSSMAGIPPLLGFVGKESLFDALLHDDTIMGTVLLVALVFTSMCFVAVSIDIGYSVFFQKASRSKMDVQDAAYRMTIPPMILGILGLAAGVFPHFTGEVILDKAVTAIIRTEIAMDLKLWHGFNLMLLLSIVSMIAGIVLFALRLPVRKGWKRISIQIDGNEILAKLLNGLKKFSSSQTSVLQSGSLKRYTSIVVIFLSLLVFYLVFNLNLDNDLLTKSSFAFDRLEIYEASVFLLIIVALWILFTAHSRLLVVATIGLIGYGLAFLYTRFSAPDIAITQFLSDTLTMMMLILILHRLPSYTVPKTQLSIPRISIAVLFGVAMTILALLTFSPLHESGLKDYFLETSPKEGHGENVVNVILVDFRALDTLGEISVLTITMLGVIALLAQPVTQER